MASNFGIRILEKNKNLLRFKVFLITSDFNFLPRTHGFGFLMLLSNAKKQISPEIEAELDMNNFCQSTYELGRKYIKKLEANDFENFPVDPNFADKSLYPLNEKRNVFDSEESLPQATYSMLVSTTKIIEYLEVGDVWESADADLWGASFYLENRKDQKFYHLYQNEMGKWLANYGKIGTPGRLEGVFIGSVEVAERHIEPKLRKSKGYEVMYKNFDTPFGLETKFLSKEDKELHLVLLDILLKDEIVELKEYVEKNLLHKKLALDFYLNLSEDYKEERKKRKKRENWELISFLREKTEED